jgi:soluble P-type ATPase
MIEMIVPGRGSFAIGHLILDLNGTIALDGKIIPGVRERVVKLSRALNVTVVTADTHGNAERLIEELPVNIRRIRESEEDRQKLEVLLEKGAAATVCIGNGRNDVLMLKESVLGICIAGGEGASVEAMLVSDIVVTAIEDALDLLLEPGRAIATLRR